jgi:hypothetical protein
MLGSEAVQKIEDLEQRVAALETEYSARECIEYAISCLKNRDSRGCTIKWLERALAQLEVKA